MIYMIWRPRLLETRPNHSRMRAMQRRASLALAGLLLAAPLAQAQLDRDCTRQFAVEPQTNPDPLQERLLRYSELEAAHQLSGLASYYSTFFDGRKTANGEIYRNAKFSAAHLTLPLGSWVEVKSRATGRKIRLRVNDRGPFAKKFMLDLSQAAARFLGVDRAPDRHVEVRLVALPGEDLLPDDETDQTPGIVKQNALPSPSRDSTVIDPP